jgi:hypothetical protein
MRVLSLVCCAVLVLAAVTAHADGPLAEPQIMLYYKLPFGGSGPDALPGFGMRVDRVSWSRNETPEYETQFRRPALLDVRMGAGRLQALNLAGADYLPALGIYRANGEEAGAEEEERRTIKDVFDEMPRQTFVGLLVGISLGIVILSGVSD